MLHRSETGRTLVEIVVILVVVALLAAVTGQAASQLHGALTAGRAKGASDQLASAIRTARQRAITTSTTHCIGISGPSYEMVVGTRSGTSCTGTALPPEDGGGPVNLIQGATVDGGPRAFEFTPVSTVDPVGGTLTVRTVGLATCTATLTVTPGGGVLLPPPVCS
jgi:type II secretory pathway pseudopilin PulG